jgi:hypothetical protein
MLDRDDFIKLDVEGMELDLLRGAKETIERCAPVMLVEVLKNDVKLIGTFLGDIGYAAFCSVGPNVLALNADYPGLGHIAQRGDRLFIE